MAKRTAKKASTKATDNKETAIVPAAETAVQVFADKSLKTGMEKVRTLQREGVEVAYELGKELSHLYDQKLWTQLHDGDGKPIYKDWSTFVKREFGISPAYSYQMMDVSLSFDKKQVSDIGVSKLKLLLSVPESKRAELLEKAKATPRTKLAADVAKLANGKKRDTGRSGFKGKAGEGRAAEKSKKLTVIRLKPKFTIPLYKADSTIRAKSANDAVGVEVTENGMTVTYTIKSTEAGLSLQISTEKTPKEEVPQAAE